LKQKELLPMNKRQKSENGGGRKKRGASEGKKTKITKEYL